MNKPRVVTLLEIVTLNHSRYPEEKFEFDMTAKEAQEMKAWIDSQT